MHVRILEEKNQGVVTIRNELWWWSVVSNLLRLSKGTYEGVIFTTLLTVALGKILFGNFTNYKLENIFQNRLWLSFKVRNCWPTDQILPFTNYEHRISNTLYIVKFLVFSRSTIFLNIVWDNLKPQTQKKLLLS